MITTDFWIGKSHVPPPWPGGEVRGHEWQCLNEKALGPLPLHAAFYVSGRKDSWPIISVLVGEKTAGLSFLSLLVSCVYVSSWEWNMNIARNMIYFTACIRFFFLKSLFIFVLLWVIQTWCDPLGLTALKAPINLLIMIDCSFLHLLRLHLTVSVRPTSPYAWCKHKWWLCTWILHDWISLHIIVYHLTGVVWQDSNHQLTNY